MLLRQLTLFVTALLCSFFSTAQAPNDLTGKMLQQVSRVFDANNISITSTTETDADQTKTISGACNFFNTTNVSYTAVFDEGDRIKSFSVGIPLVQKFDPAQVGGILKSGDWINLFIPQDIKRAMALSKYTINFDETLKITDAGAEFAINTNIPLKVFGLPGVKIANLKVGYRVDDPLGSPTLIGKFGGSILWHETALSFETTLGRNPKDFSISFSVSNLSFNDVAGQFSIDGASLAIPANVNSLLTIDKAQITIFPASRHFIFDGSSPLGKVNFVIKRVTVDNTPEPTDTAATVNPMSTSLTGAYSADPVNPDPPVNTEPAAVPPPVSSFKWGIMLGFQLPESNDNVKAIAIMRKAGLTNIGLVISTINDEVETSLPIFSNIGTGNTMVQKGVSFLAWIPVQDLLTKYYVGKLLKTISPDFQKAIVRANPFESIMFRANVPVTLTDFSLEGDLSFNDNMQLVPGTTLVTLRNLKLMVRPLSTAPEFSFGATWTMKLDPTRKDPIDFNANMIFSSDGAVNTLAVNGAMLKENSWDNPYGLTGIGFNSLAFQMGLSLVDVIPAPNKMFLAGQMKYGETVGDVTLGLDFTDITKTLVMARTCNLSLQNILDQWLGGAVKTNFSKVKNKYLSVLSEFMNLQLNDAYLKIVPPAVSTELTAGLKLKADYTKSMCSPSLLIRGNWMPGFQIAGEADFAANATLGIKGIHGLFNAGFEFNPSGLQGGMVMQGKLSPIEFKINDYTLFRIGGVNANDSAELFLDLSTDHIVEVVNRLLSPVTPESVAEPGNRLFYLNGGITMFNTLKAKTFVELTSSGYQAHLSGKLFGLFDGSADAVIGSFRDWMNTTTLSANLDAGKLQDQILDKLDKVIPEVKSVAGLFRFKSFSFSGKLQGLRSDFNADLSFVVAGNTYTAKVMVNLNKMENLLDLIVDKIKSTAGNIISQAIQGIKDLALKAYNTAKSVAEDAYNFVSNTATTAVNEIKSKVISSAQTAVKGFKDGMSLVANKMNSFISSVGKFSRSLVESIYKKVFEKIENVFASLPSKIKQAFTSSDNTERLTVDGPVYRISVKNKTGVLVCAPTQTKNYPVQLGAGTIPFTEYWELVPNDKTEETGSFFLVSSYTGLLITKPWTTHLITIPHESDHKDRERMLMEPVPNDPGYYFLKYLDVDKKNGITYYTYAEMKTVMVNDKPGFTNGVAMNVLAPVQYVGAGRPGDAGRFRFEKAGDVDWTKEDKFPPAFAPVQPLSNDYLYILSAGVDRYNYENGVFRWVPDNETKIALRLNNKPLQTIDTSRQIGIIVGAPYPSRKDGIVLQAAGDPAIYVMQDGKRRWIPDPGTFNLMGLNMNMVTQVSPADLQAIPLGEQIPVNLVPKPVFKDRALYFKKGNSTPFMFTNNSLRSIPDPETIKYLGLSTEKYTAFTDDDAKGITVGAAIPSMRDGNLYQVKGKPAIYLMQSGLLLAIPDPETFNYMQLGSKKIQFFTEEDMKLFNVGPPIKSLK